MENKTELQILVDKALEKALHRQEELAMVKMAKSEAKLRAASLWKPLNHHLIKIVMWGDSRMWRNEIKAFAEDIGEIRLSLKSRKRMNEKDHLEAVFDYRNTKAGKNAFLRSLGVVETKFPSKPYVRNVDEGRAIVFELQKAFIKAFAKDEVQNNVDFILNSVLDRYSRIDYNG